MSTLPKIIAVDFDGTLFENAWPDVGAPIEKNINKLKAEQADGAKVILWTNRVGGALDKAVNFCKEHGIHLDAVNENLPEIVQGFGTDCRKIFANEYWDDHAVWMSKQDIGEFSDGFHTFNSLYHQRLILFAALVNTFPSLAWKSRKHSDGEVPFGGGWFIVGVDTPKGPYIYHYEDKGWDLFHCREIETAPEWDGHTDKDVERVLSLTDDDESDWAAREVALASQKKRESAEDKDDWDYGVACYESALRAYQSLERDGHSGMSIQITKSILNRLIDGKCLTPIEDDPDIWTKVEFGENDPIQHFQCKRMSSLFKDVAEDGTVTYSDVNRVQLINKESPDIPFRNGFGTRLIDKMYPITLPYSPADKKFKIIVEEFLTDEKNGDFDTVGYLQLILPNGEVVDLNGYFKDGPDGMIRIEQAEYEERKARRIDKK
jgi:hypothetical protein|nr:MAG TPA_asm: nucleotidase 5'-nucleotidase [Caudoviricetes sp.]